MILTKSIFLNIFKRYDIVSSHKMCSWLWVLTYGYLFSQTLKMNTYILINKSKQTSIEFVYDLLNMLAYSVCLFHFCCFQNYEYHIDSLLYILPFTLSIIVFMYLGEVGWLKYFVVEWGFWDTLDPTAVYFLSGISLCLIALIMRQCIYRESNWIKMLCFIGIYILSWVVIDCVANAEYILHLHHAFVAVLLSIIFSKWTNQITFVIHAICMGVWVEGMNVFGTEELKIFMTTDEVAPIIDFNTSAILFGVFTGIGCLIGMTTYFLQPETLL